MCLSATKWIHLNGGDKGLQAFFKKLSDSLTPGVRRGLTRGVTMAGLGLEVRPHHSLLVLPTLPNRHLPMSRMLTPVTFPPD